MEKVVSDDNRVSVGWLWAERHETDHHLHHSITVSARTLYTYRVICSMICVAVFVWNSVLFGGKVYDPFIFVTRWGYLLCSGFFITTVLHGAAYGIQHEGKLIPDAMSSLAHILFEIGFAMQLPITFVFWACLVPYVVFFNDGDAGKEVPLSEIAFSVFLHGGFFIMIWLDNFFNVIKFHNRHFWLVAGVLTAYMTMNVIYTLAHEPIYPMITWDDVYTYLYVMIFGVLAWAHFQFGICYFNKKLRRVVIKANEMSLLETEVNCSANTSASDVSIMV